jgi:hypothetical protein
MADAIVPTGTSRGECLSKPTRSACGEGKLSLNDSTRPRLLTDMFVDAATLQDLEIVPTPTVRGITLWSLINRTRTRVGGEALRERLLNPPATAEDIRALQRAHQVLAADASVYRHTLDEAAADEVECYLNTNWQLPSTMPPWFVSGSGMASTFGQSNTVTRS